MSTTSSTQTDDIKGCPPECPVGNMKNYLAPTCPHALATLEKHPDGYFSYSHASPDAICVDRHYKDLNEWKSSWISGNEDHAPSFSWLQELPYFNKPSCKSTATQTKDTCMINTPTGS